MPRPPVPTPGTCGTGVPGASGAGLGFGGLDFAVPLGLARAPALVVGAVAPVARDGQPVEGDAALDPQMAAQPLHPVRLSVDERVHGARGELQVTYGLHQGV